MKKAIAILLVIVMAFTLIACSSSAGTSPSASAPAASAPAATESASAAPASQTPAATAEATKMAIPKVDFKGTTDPFSRKTYKICDIMVFLTPFGASMNECYKTLGTKLNYEFNYFDGNGDTAQFMTLIETSAGQGYDGMIIEADYTTEARALEIIEEYNVNYIPGLSPLVDDAGNYISSSVVMDSHDLGADAVKFMVDNFERYTQSGIDMKNVGFITVNFSVVTDLNARAQGALDKYTELFPDLVATNYFAADTVSSGVNAVTSQAAYEQVAPVVAAHPELKGWIVFGTVEDFASGAATALEDLQKKGSAIVTSCASTLLAKQWNTGYDGVWVAGIDTPPIQWADATVNGLLQIIDGTATHDTLWANMREAGQKFTVIKLPYTIVEKSNYQDYQKAIDAYLGEQYPGK